jgi:PAS domain S-box-containing protein
MNSIFSRESISFKFFSTTALVLVAGTFLLISALAVNEGFTQHRVLVKKGKGLAQYVAKLSQDPLVMGDTVQLDSIVNEARYDDDILYTVIFDRNGEAVTSRFASINYASPRIEEHRSPLRTIDELDKALEYLREHEATKEVSSPIITGEQTIGKVVVGLSKHNLIDNIVSTITFVTIFNIVIAFILGAALFIISRRIIFTPLTELTNASRSLARGDLSIRVETSAVGEISLLIGSFNQMAEDLQRTTVSREYVDNIIRSMTEALLILAPDYRIMDVNSAACRLLGYAEEELTGMPAGKIFDTVILAGITDDTLPETGLCVDTLCTRKDGSTLPILFTASDMHDSDGTFRGIVCNALDISEMKEIYRQLEKTNDALKQEIAQRRDAQEEARMLNLDLEEQKSALEFANRELESFCYSVSHDLRAPLRHINGFTNMLIEDYHEGMDESGRDYLERICAASSHMGLLIDDLLRFSKVSRAELKIADVNLSTIAEKIAAMYREAEPQRHVRFDIAPGLSARGDVSLLEMVMQNLIDNAWKYSSTVPEALITVGRTNREGEDVFFVRDNGVGFNMVYQEKLFMVFERLHGEEFDGTGIGLATVHRIIERHGGRIWADGKVGHGATFYFTL